MPVRCEVVIREEQGHDVLPEWAREGSVLQRGLVETGRWEAASTWLRVYRHVGFTAMDIASFFLHYFASGLHGSLKEFGARVSPLQAQLAALAGRRAFPTPSSVSRLLGRATVEQVRSMGPRILLDLPDATELLRHPAAAILDTFGQPWHIFDGDATNHAFRERSLPRGVDLPSPRRRCGPDLARPGYTGRKRGELRCSRGTLQHAGTGLWVSLVVSPERADGAAALPELLQGLEHACRIGSLPRERAVVRADGAGGNVPWLTVCQQQGVRYVTRWGHYTVLRQPEVQAELARGPWHRVPSAGAGPTREAFDLGEIELRASPQTRDGTGAPYEPVRSRIVVSRFRADSSASVGTAIDGWIYELFATDLPMDAWPCAELVALYFGRAAEENRFAQEDRELQLDHLFSYQLAGQELACLFGLMVWNLRQTVGFAQYAPPTELPAQTPRCALDVTATVAPPPMSTPAIAPSPDECSLVSDPVGVIDSNRVDADPVFDELPWGDALARLGPGWLRSTAGDELVCPTQITLSPSSVIVGRRPGAPATLRLRASVPACRACPRRLACAPNPTAHFAKSVHVPLTAEQRQRLDAVLPARKQARSLARLAPEPIGSTTLSPPRKPLLVLPADHRCTPGPYAPSEVRLIPSEFRHAVRRACRQIAVTVIIAPHILARPCRPLGIAYTAVDRQHRRRSWHARYLDNSLPPDARVSVQFTGPSHALEVADWSRRRAPAPI